MRMRSWSSLLVVAGFGCGALAGLVVAGAFGFGFASDAAGMDGTVAALAAGLGGGIGLALARRLASKREQTPREG